MPLHENTEDIKGSKHFYLWAWGSHLRGQEDQVSVSEHLQGQPDSELVVSPPSPPLLSVYQPRH